MPRVPKWLKSLVDEVGANIEAHDPSGPLTFLYGEDAGTWEVTVYLTPVELVGGAVDGEIVSPGFSLDLDACAAPSSGSTPFTGLHTVSGRSTAMGRTSRSRAYTEGTTSGC